MKAALFETFRQPLVIRDLPEPACPPDGAVIAVKACGVCRSDHHSWSGADPVALPHIPGHEFSGVVIEAGWAPKAAVCQGVAAGKVKACD